LIYVILDAEFRLEYFCPMIGIPFDKYQSTGNDFVIIDQRNESYLDKQDQQLIERLCDRRFGIGADGLMLLQNAKGLDFEMVYFNSDGRESTLCGNGGRSIVKYAHNLGIINEHCRFLAIDGEHDAMVNKDGTVELHMNDVLEISSQSGNYILDTGSPHFVQFVQNVKSMDIAKEGAAIRYSDLFKKEGINVNFVEMNKNGITVRTYERGVEDETLSCGTGVTAAAIASALHFQNLASANIINISTLGGKLKVKLRRAEKGFENIWLCGPATKVFSGVIEI